MKKKSDWVMLSLVIVFSSVILIFFYKSITRKPTVIVRSAVENDSTDFFYYQKSYLTQLLNIGYVENGRIHNFDTVQVYKTDDEKKESHEPLLKKLRKDKINLIIRYTEIGCNACADSTFRFVKKHRLDQAYNVLILVDFSNYDSYLKWLKVSEITYPVFWLKKGALPFKIETEDNSYVFTVNSLMQVNSFFVPNSRFSDYIDSYCHFLENKL